MCLVVKLLDSEQQIEDNIPLLNILLEKNTILENVRIFYFIINLCAPYLSLQFYFIYIVEVYAYVNYYHFYTGHKMDHFF